MSCVTAGQCEVASRLVEAYVRRYGVNEQKNPFLVRLYPKVLEYMRDTKDHCLHGKRHPEWNGISAVATYPDINRYMAGLLDFRIRPI